MIACEVKHMSELQKNPEELTELPQETKEPFVPSPRWKRVVAWCLFAVVALGIISWLLGIAEPRWTEKLLDYFRN